MNETGPAPTAVEGLSSADVPQREGCLLPKRPLEPPLVNVDATLVDATALLEDTSGDTSRVVVPKLIELRPGVTFPRSALIVLQNALKMQRKKSLTGVIHDWRISQAMQAPF